jgi:hypothetical protein
MDDNNIKKIPINELRQEEGASELAVKMMMLKAISFAGRQS